MAKTIEYKGVFYKSIRALAREYGINHNSFSHLLNKGLAIEDIILSKGKPILFDGSYYNNISELREVYHWDSEKYKTKEHRQFLEDMGFDNFLPNGDILFKSFCEFFGLHTSGIHAKIKKSSIDLGEEYKKYNYKEAKVYKQLLFEKYKLIIPNISFVILTPKGCLMLIELLGMTKESDNEKDDLMKESNVDTEEYNDLYIINQIDEIKQTQKEILGLLKELKIEKNNSYTINQLKKDNKQLNYTIDKFGNVTYQ